MLARPAFIPARQDALHLPHPPHHTPDHTLSSALLTISAPPLSYHYLIIIFLNEISDNPQHVKTFISITTYMLFQRI